MKKVLFYGALPSRSDNHPRGLGVESSAKLYPTVTWGFKTPYNTVCSGIPTYCCNYLLIKVINGINSNSTEKPSCKEGTFVLKVYGPRAPREWDK